MLKGMRSRVSYTNGYSSLTESVVAHYRNFLQISSQCLDSHGKHKTKKKNLILQAFQPFLRILTILNRDNFREKDPPILMRNIFGAICELLLISILIITYISDGLYCYEKSFDMRMASQQIAVFFGCMQIFATYLSIFRQNELVITSIKKLQRFVEERKMHIQAEQLRKLIIFHNKFHRLQGI